MQEELSFSVIIPAAGVGARTGMAVPKPWLDLEGEPMVVRTLKKFVGLPGLRKLALPVLPEEVERRGGEIENYKLPLDIVVCAGGDRRQDSVRVALESLEPEEEEVVLIHDAARPFVSSPLILEVARRAWTSRVAIAAVPAEDTIKEVGENGLVSSTPPRERYMRAQTPQAMAAGVLLRGLALADERGIELTDDAGAAELLGFKVSVVAGRRSNFKITTAEDLALARFLLREGSER
jgi:2-C-methyl-D-erythritol 4-phosphate cytidylyltransferase